MAGPTNQAVLDVLNALREDFRSSTNRLEIKIDALNTRLNEHETESGRDAVSTENIKTKVDDHETRIRELEKLAPAMKVVIWIAGVLGLSAIGLVWSLLTGQASIIFH